MNINQVEELLGEDISTIENVIGFQLKEKKYPKVKAKVFGTGINFFKEYFNTSSHYISAKVDEENLSRSITIHFREVINKEFYNSFVKKYDEPIHMYVMKNTRVISTSKLSSEEDSDFNQTMTKSEGDMVEGTFDEKPLFIIWKKEGYYIQAFLRHEQNISEIMFSLDSPHFNIEENSKN